MHINNNSDDKELLIMSYCTTSMIKHISSWSLSFLKPSKVWSQRYTRQQMFRYYLFYNCVEQILFHEAVSHFDKNNYSRSYIYTHHELLTLFTSETSGSIMPNYLNQPDPLYHFGLVLCSWLDLDGSTFKSVFSDYIHSNSRLSQLYSSGWPSLSVVTKYPIAIKRAAGFLCNYELLDPDHNHYSFFPKHDYLNCRSKALISLQRSFPSISLTALTDETCHL